MKRLSILLIIFAVLILGTIAYAQSVENQIEQDCFFSYVD